MTHKMRLHIEPFEAIKKGEKTIEVRLNDEKRREIKVGHIIELSKRPDLVEKITARAEELIICETFGELYDKVNDPYFNKWDRMSFVESVYEYYDPEKEKEHGVLGIRIKVL